MKTKHLIHALIFLGLTIACDEDEMPKITLQNFEVTIAENPTLGQSIGFVNVTFKNARHTGVYFANENVLGDLSNYISMDRETGELTIIALEHFDDNHQNIGEYFDFERQTTFTADAIVDAFNGDDNMVTETFTVTINLTDVVEVVPTEPILTTIAATLITHNFASSGGIIVSDGNSTITEQGIVLGELEMPTTADTKIVDGTGAESFTSALSDLNSNTIYYVRAYARNDIGTGYGDVLSFTTSVGIGDSYQGGIIAYILQDGDPGYDVDVPHGLIAASADQSNSIIWSNTLTLINAASQAIGSGQANTSAIVADQGAGSYAAKLCDDLVIESFDDWYLPSLDELNKLYLNKELIGDFQVAFYWSSSEESMNNAYLHSFNSNSFSPTTKNTTTDYRVRAIRSY